MWFYVYICTSALFICVNIYAPDGTNKSWLFNLFLVEAYNFERKKKLEA